MGTARQSIARGIRRARRPLLEDLLREGKRLERLERLGPRHALDVVGEGVGLLAGELPRPGDSLEGDVGDEPGEPHAEGARRGRRIVRAQGKRRRQEDDNGEDESRASDRWGEAHG
jgi:hypothetical protein